MSDTLLSLEGIKKIFFTDEIETHALTDISLTVRQGEYLAIAGPSGCGKSSLLAIMGLLDTASEGSFVFKGEDVSTIDKASRAAIRNKSIGFIFQSFNLISDLSVAENVELPLTYRKDLNAAQRKQLVNDALERLSMSHRSRHFPAQLSGGQQQRVAIARAIAGQPSILLADEPTGNLDSKNAEAVMAILDELHGQGATICMVTHDPRSSRHAKRRLEIFDGRIISDQAVTDSSAAA